MRRAEDLPATPTAGGVRESRPIGRDWALEAVRYVEREPFVRDAATTYRAQSGSAEMGRDVMPVIDESVLAPSVRRRSS
jgi:hypothetical protein